ncbi:MAG: Prolipoprotein diacylglyceryl transferase [Pelotomaculum sp. PtaB.Bin013]|nr:MAG: Prolipoprotein diacylglyceryl transferase [Pelotomaculum sp. PtaB.Bin013]
MINPVAVHIGPLAIYWYGIIMTAAFIIGAALAYRLASESRIDPDHVLNLLIYIIPAAIIGARLYYVLFRWEDYSYNLLEIFAVRHGGLAIHGGLLGGALAGLLYVRKHKLNFWQMGDIFAPCVVLGQAIGRWGNFINQEAFGGPVTREFIGRFPAFMQKQMFIDGQYHHPAFLYESLWNLLVFIFLMIYRKRADFHGQILLAYMALYSAGRFFIEGLRTDSLMLGPLRAAQVVSVIFIVAAIGLYVSRKQDKHSIRQDEHTK